ncbi:MAG: hypothetical protein EVA65_17150 [Oceanococcus sp.]|nr:MAG: hypothetical protein EVA65_17150 [Oceanococcus sp.]
MACAELGFDLAEIGRDAKFLASAVDHAGLNERLSPEFRFFEELGGALELLTGPDLLLGIWRHKKVG